MGNKKRRRFQQAPAYFLVPSFVYFWTVFVSVAAAAAAWVL